MKYYSGMPWYQKILFQELNEIHGMSEYFLTKWYRYSFFLAKSKSAVHTQAAENQWCFPPCTVGYTFKQNQRWGSRQARIVAFNFAFLATHLVEHGLHCLWMFFPLSGPVWWSWPNEWEKGECLGFIGGFWQFLPVSGLAWWLWQLPTRHLEYP